MRFPRSSQTADMDKHILPLTNVIFLLLLFFMLIGRLAAPQMSAIQPPRSVSEDTAPTDGILVQLSARGRLTLGGAPVDPAGLQMAVVRKLQTNPGQAVRLEADGQTPATQVVAVMQRLRAAGVQRLRLLTVSK